MRINLKKEFSLSLIAIIFVLGFIFISQAKAEEQATRIVISASGPAKFSSHWLDAPPRLIVEFQTKNIVSKMDEEVIVNQGVIKRITTSFFEEEETRPLKSIAFEFTQKVSYKIWQEDRAILLDIQAPLGMPVFQMGGEEILVKTETNEVIIRRLEAMDAALMQVAESRAPVETPEPKVIEVERETVEEIKKAEKEAVLPEIVALPAAEPPRKSRAMLAMVFSLAGLALVSSLGFFIWRRQKLSADEEIKKLKLELQERKKRLEEEEVVRKEMEQTALEKEKEHQRLRDSLESLKGELVKKGVLERELSPEEKERLWIPGKSQEKRQCPRLSLSQDYSRTIILRIESPNRPEAIKSYANNISSNGLCFETKEDFKEKEPINLRLFFYGDMVPMIKAQAQIKWKKALAPANHYGVSFDLLDEKDKQELNRYIESKITA